MESEELYSLINFLSSKQSELDNKLFQMKSANEVEGTPIQLYEVSVQELIANGEEFSCIQITDVSIKYHYNIMKG